MNINVRPLEQRDLPEAGRIMRIAFGTFIGVPNPERFGEGMDHVASRWRADPSAAFAAEVDGRLVGSNFAAKLGCFAFFGPLTVLPEFWDRGIAKRLLEPTMELFKNWRVTRVALFTFAHSPKHFGLYQSFGFWPRSLTFVMSKSPQTATPGDSSNFSDVPDGEKEDCLRKCRALTDSVYTGFDLRREINSVRDQKLGDTLLLRDGNSMNGLAVCHFGPGTEADKDTCYIKFGVASSGGAFDRLLKAVEELAVDKGLTGVVAGVNAACEDACKRMLARGFRTDFQGVLMLQPNKPAFDRPDCYVICDLR